MSFLLGLFALSLPLLPVMAAAPQGVAVLSGRALDDKGAPLPGTAVVLEVTGNPQPAFADVTGEDGRFTIRGVPPGTYKVRMSFPGRQPAESNLVVSELNRAYELGEGRLPPLERFAEQVTVAGTGVRAAGVDTRVFRLNEGATQSTGSLLDALKGLPGVTVDQDGTINGGCMAKVTGIGGVFFKSTGDHKKLSEWYASNLGLQLEDWGGAILKWSDDSATDDGLTVWNVAPPETRWFHPSSASFMINYRVDSLDGMLAQLKGNGIEPVNGPESAENGRFAWIIDPDGNKVELWEPILWDDKNKQ